MGVPVGTFRLNQMQEYPWVPQNLIRYRSTRRDYRIYTYFIDTGVPVGTTELVQDLYLFYGYGSTRKYYKAYTGLILILRIREYS